MRGGLVAGASTGPGYSQSISTQACKNALVTFSLCSDLPIRTTSPSPNPDYPPKSECFNSYFQEQSLKNVNIHKFQSCLIKLNFFSCLLIWSGLVR